MTTRPRPRGRWNARGAAVKQKMRHDIKFGVGFKTRIHGTKKQIGQKFPVNSAHRLPSRLRGSKISPLASPRTGAPLEPATHYGDTILYDPYSGEFHEWTPERQYGRVTPKFTVAENVGMSMARSYVSQAAGVGAGGKTGHVNLKQFEQAALLLNQASRVEPWHRYPEAGLQKNMLFVEVKDADNYVGSMLQSARETTDNPAERQKWIDKGMERIRNLNTAFIGVAGGKITIEGAADWLKHSYKIAKGYTGRASQFIEKAAETTGRIAASPKKVQEAYMRGYDPKAAEEENLKRQITLKELKEKLAPRLQQKALTGSTVQYADIGGTVRADPETRALPIKERIDRLIKRRTSPGVSPWALSKAKSQVARLRQLSTDVEALENTSSEYGSMGIPFADKVRANRRLVEIEREVTGMGGKIARQHKVSFKAHGKTVKFVAGKGPMSNMPSRKAYRKRE